MGAWLPVLLCGRENFLSSVEGSIRRGNTAVNSAMQQEFANLLRRDSVVCGGAEMKAHFFAAIQSDHERDGDETARMLGQARARPDFSPCIACDEVLELRVHGGLP